MYLVHDFRYWMTDVLRGALLNNDVKVYVVDVFSKPQFCDLSDKSVVLAYINASDYRDYKLIGDWVLWYSSINKNDENCQIRKSCGSSSYSVCYNYTKNGVYNKLSSNFETITSVISSQLQLNGIVKT